MFSSNNISIATSSSNHNFQDSNSNILTTVNYSNNQTPTVNGNHSPRCIVIGCKNAFPNPAINYYQVPAIEPDVVENNTSRQWYINTLREDLLDFILVNHKAGKSGKETHYVCIEHFDEESFAQDSIHLQDPVVLKEDAVPSLFEIEVFQKMIAHQEQIASNQHQKQNQQVLNRPTHPQQNGSSSFLSNLILNSSNNTRPQQLRQTEINSTSNHTLTPVSVGREVRAPNYQTNTQTSPAVSSTNRRVRMDPDTRAALIQRVPKAVKRTTCIPSQQTQAPEQNTTTPIKSPTANGKVQKAVKHTMPRQLLKQKGTEDSTGLKQQQKLTSKQLSSNNTNIFLKDILPPPIMQSTKRSNNLHGQTVNKAIKHTGGGSNAYYQSLNNNSKNSNICSLSKVKPFAQLNVNNLNDTAGKLQNANSSKTVNHQATANKTNMTTTYVYKRVSQQPEIDLNLECEEEDLVYIMPPVSPPPIKAHESIKPSESYIKTETSAELLNVSIPTEVSVVPDIQNLSKQETLNSIKKASKPPIKNETNLTEVRSLRQQMQITAQSLATKVVRKNITPITPVAASPSTTTTTTIATKANNSNKANVIISSPTLAAALENESNTQTTSDSDRSDESDEGEEPTLTVFVPKPVESNNVGYKPNSYANVLGKFYSRESSSIAMALESAANELEISKIGGKRSRHVPQNSEVPADLRIGNYPAKCNICSIILENNIELTSHICSHLESGESDANGMSTYISPFDAVTTTCGVCDTTFEQPFDLIKHLDQKHMKQLGEYKCRICELQHSKLSELVSHLNHTHSNQEMPYRCDACGFRTSFYADAIYHIKREHKSTLRHFCPYCLKSLSLPYNEKLGYVQCQMFYAHLITHFNKQENDTLHPSKCKHCQKCILHVRYMKDHLLNDHMPVVKKSDLNVNSPSKLKAKAQRRSEATPTSAKSSKALDSKPKKLTDSPFVKVKEDSDSSVLKQKASKLHTDINLRKRRRSTRFEDDLTADTCSTNSNVDSPANLYDFEEDQLPEKLEMKDDMTNESSTTENNDLNRPKKYRKYTKGRKILTNVNQEILQNKKVKTDTLNVASADSDLPLNRAEAGEIKLETIEVKIEHENISPSKPFMRKQKALKQTNIKNIDVNSKYHRRFKRFLEKTRVEDSEYGYLTAPKSPEIISTTLAGNVKFCTNKNNFKCVECGDTDLKTHFKNDYTCHQCKYNTNCSNSFEYHLHGHLVSKRVAMWNKVLKTPLEEYKCRCGFILNSTRDNACNANTGNKVADHMMKCEYKYCSVSIEKEPKVEVVKTEPEDENSVGRDVEVIEINGTNAPKQALDSTSVIEKTDVKTTVDRIDSGDLQQKPVVVVEKVE